jgi:hypothetical protein
MRTTRFGAGALTALLLASVDLASAQSMFVRNPSQHLGYGYNNYYWTTFTGMWNARFGPANITQGNSIGSLAGYSALMLDPSQSGTSAYNLSAGEIASIASFLGGGGRLYAFGENDSWTPWNTNVLSMFGATFGGLGSNAGTPLVSNSLTAGVSSINTPAPGFIADFNGGASQFSNDIVGLFNSDALVVLDLNICDDTYITYANNAQFCQNIVNFTAGDPLEPNTIPEPTTMALLAAGLVGMIGARRRRRKQA